MRALIDVATLTQEALARLGYSSGPIDDDSGGRVPTSKADWVKAVFIACGVNHRRPGGVGDGRINHVIIRDSSSYRHQSGTRSELVV